jgi:carbamoyltransferase
MNRTIFEYHPTIGYKFLPQIKARIPHEAGGYFVVTNSDGFRSDWEYEKKHVVGKKRVLVFGDSFTAGDGVSNKYRYTDLLQRMNPDIELYNFGLPGSGTDQQWLLYQEYGQHYEHDLLVIAVLVENVRRVNSTFRYFMDGSGEQKVWMKPYFEEVNGRLVLKNTPVQPEPIEISKLSEGDKQKIDTGGRFEPLRKLVNRLGLKDIVQKVVHFQPVPEYDSPNSKEWLLLKTILESWASQSPVPVLIVPIPLFHHVEGTADASPYQQRFSELECKGKVFDPLPDLMSYDATVRRSFRFEKDVHLTPAGHEAIATSLNKILKSYL